jgi:hypothetical protein
LGLGEYENMDEKEAKYDIKLKKAPPRPSLEEALKGKNLSEKALQLKLHSEMKLLGQDLDSDERTVLDCFRKPRLVLERVQIIFNQTMNAMGTELKTKEQIRSLLGSLSEKEYINIEKFEYQGEEKEAFILTDIGKQLLD